MMNNNTVDQVCFSRRITKEEATELVLAGWCNVMCLEYGDDEVDENGLPYWTGLTIDDIDEETGKLDDDLKTFELW